MSFSFDESVIAGVLGHMNSDHGDDNLLISRAFSPGREVTTAVMTGFDGDGGWWEAALADGSTHEVHLAWLGGPISERPQVRREIVALYDEACRLLGVEPRPHA